MFRIRNFLTALLAGLALWGSAAAQEPIRFARGPDISPDGRHGAFRRLGGIWGVAGRGGSILRTRETASSRPRATALLTLEVPGPGIARAIGAHPMTTSGSAMPTGATTSK